MHCNDQNKAPEVFRKKGVFRNFAKITGKHPCQSLFFKKVTGSKRLIREIRFAAITNRYFFCYCISLHLKEHG